MRERERDLDKKNQKIEEREKRKMPGNGEEEGGSTSQSSETGMF